MPEKICIIKQPAGVGDIFFCLKIPQILLQQGRCDRVIWPVVQEYSYLKNYLHYDNIEFVHELESFPFRDAWASGHIHTIENEDLLYIPLQTSDTVQGVCRCHGNNIAHGHMKYNFVNMDYRDWKDYFHFTRNYEREQALINKLGIDPKEPYNIVNRNYGTYPNYLTRFDIDPQNGVRNIHMRFHPETTLFDWIGILEKATEIHTVETSLYYILDKMGFNNVTIYSKFPERGDDFSYMKDSTNPDWRYVQ
jgi:hypothetical protein